MHKTILTIAVALFATTATIAQEKSAPVMAPASATGDALTQQKRELSRELKNSLGNTENMIRQLKEMSTTATGDDQAKFRTKVEELSGTRTKLTEQLDLVNKATAENSKGVFGTAREVIAASSKALEAYKSELGGTGGKMPATK